MGTKEYTVKHLLHFCFHSTVQRTNTINYRLFGPSFALHVVDYENYIHFTRDFELVLLIFSLVDLAFLFIYVSIYLVSYLVTLHLLSIFTDF